MSARTPFVRRTFPATAADPNKILRIASVDIETFDPQQFTDNPSFEVFTAIYEGLYEYDYLASPPKLSTRRAATFAPVPWEPAPIACANGNADRASRRAA